MCNTKSNIFSFSFILRYNMWSAVSLIVLVQVYLLGAVLEPGSVGHHPPTSHLLKRSINRARRPDYTYTRGVGAHKFFTQQAGWNVARRTCEQDNAHLVIINSVAEAEVISRLLNGSGIQYYYSWVGVHDLYHEDEFVTIHDQPLVRTGYDKWQPGEPNNLNNTEHCVLVTYLCELVDIPCDDRRSFVCEIP